MNDFSQKGEKRIKEYAGKIKGRGNNTWWRFPKKPYKIEFNEKVSFFGLPQNKDWALLANYADKSLIRTQVVMYMGQISNLDWTPHSDFVEVFLNDKFQGCYELIENIKIGKNRVNVTEDGYILEVDNLYITDDDVSFKTQRLPLNVKKPKIEKDGERHKFISDYVQQVERILYSDTFLDKEIGYKKYVDIESFVEWYIINEICRNQDSYMWTSCFMNVSPDGIIRMGPLWDYDNAFGNSYFGDARNPEGFWIKKAKWFERLFLDPEFVSLVKERFDYYYNKKEELQLLINSKYQYLKKSVVENENVWNVLYQYAYPNYEIWGAYENEVYYVKWFLDTRMKWLKENINRL